MNKIPANIQVKPGTIFTPWIDPRLEERPSPIAGRGLFACQPIQAGEVVVIWGGTVFSQQELLAGKAIPDTVAVLDEGLYLADPAGALPGEDYTINHSCDPNLWMEGAITLIARRAVNMGEELTADYAVWLDDENWALESCHCGAPACRGRITGKDWRLPELQARYAGHFTPYLDRLIARYLENQSLK